MSLAVPALRRMLTSIPIMAALTTLALTPAAMAIDYTITSPTDDRLVYPFASNPGTRTDAYNFCTNQANFNQRDATLALRFDTATAGIATGQPIANYDFTAVTVTLWHKADVAYAWDTRSPVNDELQIFGMGVGTTAPFTLATWNESSPYRGLAGSPGTQERDPHPLNISDSATPQNVTEVLAATPWGTGVPVYGTAAGEYTPGVAPAAVFPVTFTVNVANARVKDYIRTGLSAGAVHFIISNNIVVAGPGGSPPIRYPFFLTKESGSATAPSLTLQGVTVGASVGDWQTY